KPGAANTASAKRTSEAAVGSFAEGMTPDSIVDLIGNVWEWTNSPMQAYPGAPPLPGAFRDEFRVIRGGAFNSSDAIATVWNRGYNRPSTQPEDLAWTGFRCMMPARSVGP